MRVFVRYQLIAAAMAILSMLLLPGASAGKNRSALMLRAGASLAPGDPEPPTADLGVSKSAPDSVNPGSDISYEITVINSGPDAADTATLSDTLPPTLTFVSVSAPAGWTCMTPTVGVTGTITCTNPGLDPTPGDVFTLVAHVPADAVPGDFVTNTATVSTTTLDPNDENNSSTASTLVTGSSSADLAVNKLASSGQAAAGDQLTYTIQVTNSGPDSADNVTLTDVLSSELLFNSLISPAGWTCMTPSAGTSGTISCSNPSLALTSGDTFTLVVTVQSDTPVGTIISNTATVGTSTSDPTTENNSDTAAVTVVGPDPTAADGKVSGRILDNLGNPVSGVVIRLRSAHSRKTITDANGNYQFEQVETGAFYTVTPSRANYNFNPFNRSFSQTGSQTESTFTANSLGDNANPLDTAEYFVRQQYLDILGREPDESGLNYWSDQILACAEDASCTRAKRTGVAAAFFMESEGQQTNAFIYDVYAGALGRRPGFGEYTADRLQVVGGATLATAKTSFVLNFAQRAEFSAKYEQALTGEGFVAALLETVASSGGNLDSERENLITVYEQAGGDLSTRRAAVLGSLADNARFKQSQYNQAFVLTEYFSYLRRDIDRRGYDFWVGVLNSDVAGNYRGMVCSFTSSAEYQNRFSRIVSHGNGECGQ